MKKVVLIIMLVLGLLGTIAYAQDPATTTGSPMLDELRQERVQIQRSVNLWDNQIRNLNTQIQNLTNLRNQYAQDLKYWQDKLAELDAEIKEVAEQAASPVQTIPDPSYHRPPK